MVPIVLVVVPLVWASLQGVLTREGRLVKRITTLLAIAEKLPPDGEARAELDRHIEDLTFRLARRRRRRWRLGALRRYQEHSMPPPEPDERLRDDREEALFAWIVLAMRASLLAGLVWLGVSGVQLLIG